MSDEIEPGSKCKKCNEGRVALVSSAVCEGDMDDEPYTNGVPEGNNETIRFEDFITLSVHACDKCGHVYDVFVE